MAATIPDIREPGANSASLRCVLYASRRHVMHLQQRFLDSRIKGRRYLMPGRKHVRGVGSKEQRTYEHIKASAKKEGRYGKRAEEVAARTVLKHHKEEGHTKGR